MGILRSVACWGLDGRVCWDRALGDFVRDLMEKYRVHVVDGRGMIVERDGLYNVSLLDCSIYHAMQYIDASQCASG